MRLNQKDYAKHRGVTAQYISRLVREGKIPTGRDGLIAVAKADKALGPRFRKPARKAAPQAKRTAAPRLKALPRESSTASLTAARARKASADAEVAELMVARDRGLLVSKEEVLAAQRKQNSNIRTRLRMLPRAVAPLLANASSAAECERILLEIIDRELSDLSRDPLALQTSATMVPVPLAEPQPGAEYA